MGRAYLAIAGGYVSPGAARRVAAGADGGAPTYFARGLISWPVAYCSSA